MRTLLLLLMSLFLASIFTCIVLIIGLFSSASYAGTGGITMVVGGLSNTLFTILLVAFPVSFVVIFLMLRKSLERKH